MIIAMTWGIMIPENGTCESSLGTWRIRVGLSSLRMDRDFINDKLKQGWKKDFAKNSGNVYIYIYIFTSFTWYIYNYTHIYIYMQCQLYNIHDICTSCFVCCWWEPCLDWNMKSCVCWSVSRLELIGSTSRVLLIKLNSVCLLVKR